MVYLYHFASLLVLAVLSSSAMAQSAETQLYGVWELDKEKSIALLSPHSGDDGVKEAIDELRNSDFGIRICFEAGRLNVTVGGDAEAPSEMAWKTLKEFSLKKIEIEIREGSDDDAEKVHIEFVAADLMHLTHASNPGPTVFARVKIPR